MMATSQALITQAIRHPPPLVLIQNNTHHSNHALLTHYLQIWISNKQTPTVVSVLALDSVAGEWNRVKNLSYKPCFLIDGFSDPSGWNSNTAVNSGDHSNVNNSPFTASHPTRIDLDQINSKLTDVYNQNKQKIPTNKDYGIIIDNINILFLHFDPFEVIRFLKQISKEFSLVAFLNSKPLLNSSLLRKNDLLNSLHFISEVSAQIIDLDEAEPESESELDDSNTQNLYILHLLAKKKSGRVNKEAVFVRNKPETIEANSGVEKGFLVFNKVKRLKDKAEVLKQREFAKNSKMKKVQMLTKKQKEEQDQKKREAEEKAKKKMEEELGNLTFKLSLTEEENEARKSVVLPYIHYGESDDMDGEPAPNDSDDLDDFDDDEEPDSD